MVLKYLSLKDPTSTVTMSTGSNDQDFCCQNIVNQISMVDFHILFVVGDRLVFIITFVKVAFIKSTIIENALN